MKLWLLALVIATTLATSSSANAVCVGCPDPNLPGGNVPPVRISPAENYNNYLRSVPQPPRSAVIQPLGDGRYGIQETTPKLPQPLYVPHPSGAVQEEQ